MHLHPKVGFGFAPAFWALPWRQRQDCVDRINRSEIDYVCVSDHVAFRGGHGWDALTQAALLAGHGVEVPIHLGVLLLPLRHPTLVARQLLDISRSSNGGVVCGVGVGGEDPDEYAMVGLAVHDRGARMSEALPLLRQMLDDAADLDIRGQHVEVRGPGLRSSNTKPVSLMVGGSAPIALERAAHVDGWIGTFANYEKWAASATIVRSRCSTAVLGHQLWAGVGSTTQAAHDVVSETLTSFYGLPSKFFARHTPLGGGRELADFLRPWVDGALPADQLSIFAVGPSTEEAIDAVAETTRLLRSEES